MLADNPMLQGLVDNNPELKAMANDPEKIKELINKIPKEGEEAVTEKKEEEPKKD
jgi:hypothetical protein